MEWKQTALKSIWKMNKEKLIFLFCSGLLLFVLSIPGNSDSVAAGSKAIVEKEDFAEVSYEKELESRIREILGDVEGVGGVDVMVVLKSSEEKTIYVDKDVFPELSGIIISADGGGSTVVKAEISEAMEALFGLPSHKIKVLKRVKKES